MSETEAAAAAMAVASFPDVIISKILKRVPDLVSLFRCSLVCKEWRGLVSDPAFLRRRGIRPQPDGGEQSSSQPSLVGIFVQCDSLRDNFQTHPPTLVPVPGSDLRPQHRCLASFVRDAGGHDGILDGASPSWWRSGPKGGRRHNSPPEFALPRLTTAKGASTTTTARAKKEDAET
jgi:hypothetical protein